MRNNRELTNIQKAITKGIEGKVVVEKGVCPVNNEKRYIIILESIRKLL